MEHVNTVNEGDVVNFGGKTIRPEKAAGAANDNAQKISVRHAFGPGAVEDHLGIRFHEKPAYFEDIKRSIFETGLSQISDTISEYTAEELYGTNDVPGPQAGFRKDAPNAGNDPYILRRVGPNEDSYLCYKGAQSYCRFWLKIKED